MDELYWKLAIGPAGIVGAVVAFGVLHSIVETKTGYRLFTRQRLTLLSFTAALYHGAYYLQDHTGYLAGKPWAFPAMVACALIIGCVVIFQNFKHAGIGWGTLVTAAQASILIVLGPMVAAMLTLFVFRGMTKGWGNGGGAVLTTPTSQPNFLYPNNMPY